MIKKNRILVLLLAVCLVLAAAGGAAASMHEEKEDPAFDVEVIVGYDGIMTYGKTMPVLVRIRNFGGDFEGVLGMNAYIDAKHYDRIEKEIAMPAGTQREFIIPMTVYARQAVYTAEIVRDGEVVCAANGSPDLVVNPSAMLIGVFSSRPQNLNNLNITRENDILARYELWQTIALTQDTFPDDVRLLRSFGILVADDLDPAALSQKQQEALDEWLRGGRILICGGGAGAARNTAYFSKYTGLSLEGMTTSGSVIGALENLISRAESGKSVQTTLAQYSGADPLSRDADGNGLVYRTEAGAGRIYTAAFETGDPRLNSETLMHYFWQQLLLNYDGSLYSNVFYSDSGSYPSATVSAGYSLPVKVESRMLPGVMIVAGALALACAFWWILKKKDLRQWMWLVLPLVCLAATAGILVLSLGSETNKPLAAVAENLVQDASGVVSDYSSYSVATPAFGWHRYSAEGSTLQVENFDYLDYFDEEEEEKSPEPYILRTRYTEGGENSVEVEQAEPWAQLNLTADLEARVQGRVEGEVWMEEDGLHGEVVNGTDLSFGAGRLVTTYGYVSLPALEPGMKAEFVMARATFSTSQNHIYEDGKLYLGNPGLYSVVSNAMGFTEDSVYTREAEVQSLRSSMINNAAEIIRRGQGTYSYGATESAVFLYCAEPLNLPETELKVDGEPVTHRSGIVMMTAEIPYVAVGRTGVVFRNAGMDVPERVEIDDEGMPTDSTADSGKNVYYHALIERPTFRFILNGLEGVRVESLQVQLSSYYTDQSKCYALNAGSGEWEEIPLNADVKDPGKYLNAKGELYLQFRSDNGADMYADISTPLISLEGRLEHAEN